MSLYICGKVASKGARDVFWPLDNSSYDHDGDAPVPAPLVGFPRGVEFARVRVELNMIAALETTSSALWVVASHGKPTKVIDGGVVDFAVGDNYALAALQSGELVIVGSMGRTDKSADGLKPRTFSPKPPAGVVAVAASYLQAAVITAEGDVFTIGDDKCGNGHGEALLRDKWKQIKLTDKYAHTPGGAEIPSSPVGAAAASSAADSGSKEEKAFKAVSIAQGCLHGAAVSACGKVFVWGDGLSGSLGVGTRQTHAPWGHAIPHDFSAAGGAVSVACTTGQLNPKRIKSKGHWLPGEEGPRTHIVCRDGSLWIAGTTHKGLAADSLSITLGGEDDKLSFYRVGTLAADKDAATPTGAAEDLARTGAGVASPAVVARRAGMKLEHVLDKEDKKTVVFGKDANKKTNYLSDVQIVSTSCAHISSCATSSDGRVFMWGCGSDGRTGLAGFLRGSGGRKRSMKFYVATPSMPEALEGKTVLDAWCGRYASCFVVKDE